MPKPFIMVATPCFGGLVTQPYFMSMLQLTHRATREDIDIDVLTLGGDALIGRARSTLVARFLAHPEATHLLFVDADISFQPDQVLRLLRFDRDFAGCLYPLKQVDWTKLPLNTVNGESLHTAGLGYVGKLFDQPPDLRVEQGFATAEYAGTGFQLIKRGVFEALIAAFPELHFRGVDVATNAAFPTRDFHALFDSIIDPITRTYLSEDFSFCRRWRAIGGDIWLDLESRITHSGTQHFAGDTAHRLASIRTLESQGLAAA